MLDEMHEGELLSDPYRFYDHMRFHAPVYWRKRSGAWFITYYEDVVAALRNPLLSAVNLPKAIAVLPWLKNTDAPDHTRLRKAANKAFYASMTELTASRVATITDELLDSRVDKGSLNIIGDLAVPFANLMIVDLLGLPRADRMMLREFSEVAGSFIGSMNGVDQLGRIRTAVRSLKEMRRYMLDLIAKRRNRPQNDMLSLLLVNQAQQDDLTDEDLLAICIEVVFAGQETTTNLLGNGFLALLRHPDQLRLLRDDPSLIKGAVEEMLRYESPVQSTPRVALEDMTIHGQTIKQGQRVVLCLGAANRDPAQFPEPNRFDIRRQPNRHVAFGYGSHYCLGAALARIAAHVVFTRVLERLVGLELSIDEVEWVPNPGFRGLKALPVTFRTASSDVVAASEPRRTVPGRVEHRPNFQFASCPVAH